MTIKKAVLATVAYHGIFNYPLKNDEIYKYLINKKTSQKEVNKSVKFLLKDNIIKTKSDYYFPSKKPNFAQLRSKREKYSQVKLKKAYFYAKILRLVPTIKCVCITGALAMNNCTKDDDIDLLIICQKKRLWTTRFLANFMLFPFKRIPKSKNTNNKACLNIFLDESDLVIRSKNLYTAHEISQTKLLWDINNSYLKFVKKNNWILNFLPNWKPEAINQQSSSSYRKQKNAFSFSRLALVAEFYLKKIQLRYMKSKITTETIGDTQLFFHTTDIQSVILKKYYQKISKL